MSRQVLTMGAANVDQKWVEELLNLFRARGLAISKDRTSAAFLLGVKRGQLDVRMEGLFDPEARAFIQEFSFNAIKKLTDDQRAFIRQLLLDSIADGEGAREVAKLLRVGFDQSERSARLRTIARTELNRASNWGRMSAWRGSGIVEGKEFIAANDDRVREGHLAADGDVVPLDKPFKRGDAAGKMAPPIAPNCRCTHGPVTSLKDGGSGDIARGILPETKEQAARRRAAEKAFGFGAPVDEHFPGLRKMEAQYERELFDEWNKVRDQVIAEVRRTG